jgi:Fur family ferric uptake transcriptional regulator
VFVSRNNGPGEGGMKPVHSEEKKQFKKLFQQEHVDRFEDRFRVLQVFLETEHHVTAAELHQMLKTQGTELDINFVRETLQFMCRFGFARRNRFDNGEQRYEHFHLGQHHDHMICTKCRKIIEFKDNQLEMQQSRVADSFGFLMLQHKMEIYGICADCLRQRVPLMPLSSARQGERLVIKEINGGPTARLRLLSMGLRIGDRLEVLTNNGQGQIAVAVDFTRYVLGRGMAQKLLVSPVDIKEEKDAQPPGVEEASETEPHAVK